MSDQVSITQSTDFNAYSVRFHTENLLVKISYCVPWKKLLTPNQKILDVLHIIVYAVKKGENCVAFHYGKMSFKFLFL